MRLYLSILVILALIAHKSTACTTAIISGKTTLDGKAVLWKMRDTEKLNNKLKSYRDGKYNYVGIINSDDSKGEQIWGGYNSSGFAIINSASFNVNLDDTVKLKDQEGFLMHEALKQCSSVDEFETFLQNHKKPLGVSANFGVIDANGNGAYFETDNYHFIKYDVNDSATAPNGYLIRTNYSEMGKDNVGYGFIRYKTTKLLMDSLLNKNALSAHAIKKEISRTLINSLIGSNFNNLYPNQESNPYMISTADFICRHESASSIVIQGALSPKKAKETVMWSSITCPYTTVYIPIWLTKKAVLPSILSAKSTQEAELGSIGLKIKELLYPIHHGSGYKYADLNSYQGQEGIRISKKIRNIETKIETEAKNVHKERDVIKFYKWIDEDIIWAYKESFPFLKEAIAEN